MFHHLLIFCKVHTSRKVAFLEDSWHKKHARKPASVSGQCSNLCSGSVYFHINIEWFGLEGTLMTLQFQPSCHGQGCHPPHQVADFIHKMQHLQLATSLARIVVCAAVLYSRMALSDCQPQYPRVEVPLVHKELLASGISKQKINRS